MEPGETAESATGLPGSSSAQADDSTSGMGTSTTNENGLSTDGSSSGLPPETGTGEHSTSTGEPDPVCELENGITVLYDCSTFAQDCPACEKCVPYNSSGLGGWNATRCVPIPDTPVPVGATCSAPQGVNAGDDDCGRGLVCTGIQV